jgi:phenylacetate-CoA ligase
MPERFSSRAAILAHQLGEIRALLAALIPANPFYTRKLAGLKSPAEISSLPAYCGSIPFTIKPELAEDQAAHPPYGTNLTFPRERYTRLHQTSGTTGTPLRWLDTPESWDGMVDSWTEVYRAAEVGPGDRVYFAFSFGPFIGFWLAFEAAAKMGLLCLPGGGLSSAARLRALFSHRVTVLCCTPTYALRLAEVAAEEKMDLSEAPVRKLILAGEPGASIPATRARLEQLWPGARVCDHHGMTEVGPVTYECPIHPARLHVVEAAYLAEVIDPANSKPVAPGETGELVLTTLGRVGSPLLRYRTGDIVRPVFNSLESSAPACECGRYELALDGGILGRTDDMVVIRGVNVFPSAVEEVMRSFPGVAEYQVRISHLHALAEMSIEVEPAPGWTDGEALVKQLERAFDRAFALRVPISLVAPGSLPRFELKARRWLRAAR